jgi:hypothetical protein
MTVGLSAAMVDQASAAGDNQAANQAKLEGACDYIIMGAATSGAIVYRRPGKRPRGNRRPRRLSLCKRPNDPARQIEADQDLTDAGAL